MNHSKQLKSSRLKRSRKADLAPAEATVSVKDYVMLNVVFDIFCIVQLVIVRILIRDFAGLYFFFGFIMCAFLVASVFDYLSEKLDVGGQIEANAEQFLDA